MTCVEKFMIDMIIRKIKIDEWTENVNGLKLFLLNGYILFFYFKGTIKSKYLALKEKTKKVKNGGKDVIHLAPFFGVFGSFWDRYGLKWVFLESFAHNIRVKNVPWSVL